MSEQATILHADLDAFYAAVEQRDDPRLRGRPVIVGGGVVLAASYEAKARGVRTAMSEAAARRSCPEAITVPPRMKAYSAASRDVFDVFEQTSPHVEGLSIDEAFLDVAGMEKIAGSPEQIARRLREQVHEQVGLTITIGVARTKFLAKVASGVAKPDGLLVVDPEHELEFLHPLEVERIWGVGKVTAKRLHDLGMRTVGDIARRDEAALCALLGKAAGRHLHALAHNRDPRRVTRRPRRRSIGAQRALGRRPRSIDDLDAMVVALVDKLGRRLRASDRAVRTVVLRLRFGDYTKATRSQTMRDSTTHTDTILSTARELLAAAAPEIEQRGLTLIGVALANLDDEAEVQMTLDYDESGEDMFALDSVLDGIRDRYGGTAITRARLLHHDPGVSVPKLPD